MGSGAETSGGGGVPHVRHTYIHTYTYIGITRNYLKLHLLSIQHLSQILYIAVFTFLRKIKKPTTSHFSLLTSTPTLNQTLVSIVHWLACF